MQMLKKFLKEFLRTYFLDLSQINLLNIEKLIDFKHLKKLII